MRRACGPRPAMRSGGCLSPAPKTALWSPWTRAADRHSGRCDALSLHLLRASAEARVESLCKPVHSTRERTPSPCLHCKLAVCSNCGCASDFFCHYRFVHGILLILGSFAESLVLRCGIMLAVLSPSPSLCLVRRQALLGVLPYWGSSNRCTQSDWRLWMCR